MNIVLINTPQKTNTKVTRDMAGGLGITATNQIILPPLDLAILSTTLRKNHTVVIIDPVVEKLNFYETLDKTIISKPDIVIATVSLPLIDNDSAFIKTLKAETTIKVIIKTSISHPPILKKILKDSRADYGLFGEVDIAINDIIEGETDSGTFRLENNKIVIKTIDPVSDLNLLPLPSRDLLKNSLYQYPLLGKNCTVMQTSRGCPFECAYYCPYPLVQGRKWRAMNPERVCRELKDCVNKYKINNILFRDATFTLNRERTITICQKIIKDKIKFSWWCETRINCLDEELMKQMKKAGCRGINIGVETGDPETLKKQGKPGVSLFQLESINQSAQNIGLKFHFLLLIGLPQENRRSLFLTFKLIKKLKPDSLGVTIVTPYPGTQLFAEAVKNQWIKTKGWDKYSGNNVIMKTDNLKSWEMKLAQKAIIGEIFLLKQGKLGQIALFFEEIFFKIWAFI